VNGVRIFQWYIQKIIIQYIIVINQILMKYWNINFKNKEKAKNQHITNGNCKMPCSVLGSIRLGHG